MIMRLFYKVKHRIKNDLYFKYEMKYIENQFCECGKNVVVSPGCIIAGHGNISLGDNTYIGPECLLYSTGAKLKIGKDVTIGPRVAIVTGDHRFDVIGNKINENKEKLPQNDQNVIIEDDCWIGINVNIFKGVTIGRGSVIAGGATVVRDIPPYSVYISKDLIRPRFSKEQIVEHEKLLLEKRNINAR